MTTSAMPGMPTEPSADAIPPAPAGRPRRLPVLGGVPLMLAMVVPAQLLAILGIVGSAAQPRIAQHFHTTQISWFSLASALVTLVAVPFAMKCAELYGKRRVMLILTAAGVVGDIVAALAPSYGILLLGRALTGLYGPVVAVIHACVREYFPPRRMALAYGVVLGSIGAITLVTPLIAGRLVDSFDWQGAMWFLAALTAFAFAMILLMPETPRRARLTGRFDWPGGLLLGGGVALIVYGVGHSQDAGWNAPAAWGTLAAGVAALLVFVPVEARTPAPIVDVRMLTRRPVAVVIAAAAFVQFAFIISPTLLSFLAQFPDIPGVSDAFGWSTTRYAVVGIPAGAATVAAGVVTGAALRRTGARPLWFAGSATLALGLLLFSQFHHTTPQVVLSGVVTGIGGGMVMAIGTAMIVSVVSPDEQATVNGMAFLLLQMVGGFSYQFLFTVLSSDRTLLDGTALYGDSAYANGYLFLAGIALAGVLVSLFLPRIRRLDEEATGMPRAADLR